ncbi:pregnancy-associated plasma protein-A [Kordia sp. SMS9]|uniref:M43 family zinc metalloprotease n=1 Tax=Kordia sp. SMS9 TaxID=2282170 RepID=UPI000E0DECA0|nr:M43 family zinc metalloprotease [Kordia sp. SMS9]AXG69323.1 pregnancy-associated plasma protein-A [Kordia sp. SMS9]
MKKSLSCIFLFCMLFFSYAQQPCGQDIVQQQLYATHPELRPENNPAFQQLEQFTNTFQASPTTEDLINVEELTIGTDYIIPVVVHIIHNNGVENISDAAVERAIESLNLFFAGTTAFDPNIDPSFLPVRAGFNTKKLRFVLAKFDPQGNPTNGIDRQIDGFYTFRGNDPNMRLIYHWPREKYFNIYVVRQAVDGSGTSGFATFPPNVADPANAYLDGHVMSAWAFGEHGEMVQNWFHNLAHEVGHWLNVYHIWANAGGNGDAVYCSFDDSVTDTPNTKGNAISDLDNYPGPGAVINCGSVDNLTNMMDYTAATYAMFTQGQKVRMEAALNSTVADRNNLWSIDNVLTTLYGCTSGLDSDLDNIPDACDPCPNDPNNDSDGDGVCDSLDACNGYPDVNVDANPTELDACDTTLPIIDFSTETIVTYDVAQDNGVSDVYDNGATLYVATNGWKAIAINYTITPNTVIEFDFMSTIDGEIHYIGIDDDLTLDPLLAYKLYGFQNVSASAIYNLDFNNYTDADQYTFKHYNIPIGQVFTGNAPYLFFAADNDSFNNTFTNNNYPGGGSYNDATSFYRNVKIYENNVLSTAELPALDTLISMYPNPAQNEITIAANEGILLENITIIDINGKVVKSVTLKNQIQNRIDINDISSGVYFVNIRTNTGKTVIKKLIKI